LQDSALFLSQFLFNWLIFLGQLVIMGRRIPQRSPYTRKPSGITAARLFNMSDTLSDVKPAASKAAKGKVATKTAQIGFFRGLLANHYTHIESAPN